MFQIGKKTQERAIKLKYKKIHQTSWYQNCRNWRRTELQMFWCVWGHSWLRSPVRVNNNDVKSTVLFSKIRRQKTLFSFKFFHRSSSLNLIKSSSMLLNMLKNPSWRCSGGLWFISPVRRSAQHSPWNMKEASGVSSVQSWGPQW